MGVGLFFDYQTVRNLNAPINARDVALLDRLHAWVMLAFGGLWLTGIALIYIRTGFELANFSPKLWLKIGIMTMLAVNAVLIGRLVVPVMDAHIGQPLATLSRGRLFGISQIAIFSMTCWTLGMALGSSEVLARANWDVLIPVAVGWAALMTIGGQTVVSVLRLRGTGHVSTSH